MSKRKKMATITVLPTQIRKIVGQLVEKAMEEIPKMPTFTVSKEYYDVTIQHEGLTYALSCSPASEEMSSRDNKMMAFCAIFLPFRNIKLEMLVLSDPIDALLEKIQTKKEQTNMVEQFEAILENIRRSFDNNKIPYS